MRQRLLPVSFLFLAAPLHAHLPDDRPPIPVYELTDQDLERIDFEDGSIADWQLVLGDPSLLPTSFFSDPTVGDGAVDGPASVDYRIWLGWHDRLDRLYVGLERWDDVYVNEFEGGNVGSLPTFDSFEFMVDGDHSGGQYSGGDDSRDDFDEELDNSQAQRFWAISESPDGILLWAFGAASDWRARPPFADWGAYVADGDPTTVLEFFVTPFDEVHGSDPAKSRISALEPDRIIGLQIALPDFDAGPGRYESLHTLSGQRETARRADRFADAVLLPAPVFLGPDLFAVGPVEPGAAPRRDTTVLLSPVGRGSVVDGSRGEVTFSVRFADAGGTTVAGQPVDWAFTPSGAGPAYVLLPDSALPIEGVTSVTVPTDAGGFSSVIVDAEGDLSSAGRGLRVEATTSAVVDGEVKTFSVPFHAAWSPETLSALTTPNGGERWPIGSPQQLRWTPGTSSEVAIDYTTDGGRVWRTIGARTRNDGQLDWTVPGPPSSNVLVRIRNLGGAADTSDAPFSIVGVPPHDTEVFEIPELTDADLATLDLQDGSLADWQRLGPPDLLPIDFAGIVDPADLDFRIWLRWHDASDRLYLAMARSDNLVTTHSVAGQPMSSFDSVEFMVDGDHSGGPPVSGQHQRYGLLPTATQMRVSYEGPGQDWVTSPPYTTSGGHSGSRPRNTVIELAVTPFDLILPQPEESVVSTLAAGRTIGFAMIVWDYDGLPGASPGVRTLPSLGIPYFGQAELFVDGLLVGAHEGDVPTIAPSRRRPPPAFTLRQNRPNPFNASTVIEYRLDRPSDVSLSVFSVAGQLVRRFVLHGQPVGPHSVVWDGRDAAGRQVSSGVYLYELRAGGRRAWRRMVIVN